MKTFKNFDHIPEPNLSLVKEAIERYSLIPETNRLVFPVVFTPYPVLMVAEIPIDDPSLAMLIICTAPASVIRASTFPSPRMRKHITEYHQRGGGLLPVDPGKPLNGCGVIAVERTNTSIINVDAKTALQFHPLFNINSQLPSYANHYRVGLVNRFTRAPGQPATSRGCVAVARVEDFVMCDGGFNDMLAFADMEQTVTGTLATLGTPAYLRQKIGVGKLLDDSGHIFDKRPEDLSMLEAGWLLNKWFVEKTGRQYVTLSD